jgi:hypothetical protein
MFVNAEALVRSLPDIPDVIAKLRSGAYTLHGGVVRHAAGTGKGGQIVGHLLYPGDSQHIKESLQNLQTTLSDGLGSLQTGMDSLQQSMNALQGLQAANLVMTGLNLAVTTAGFVIVCRKLDKISEQIQAQSQTISHTWQMVSEAHERNLLTDEARFRGLLSTAQQFCEEGDVYHLKSLINPFNEQYQFTKLLLQRHSGLASSNGAVLDQISLLQNRLVNLGLMRAHVQFKAESLKYSQQNLTELGTDIASLNGQRVEALSSDRNFASTLTHEQFGDLTRFLQDGRSMIPALTYQAEVIELEAKHPGLLKQTYDAKEILLVAA